MKALLVDDASRLDDAIKLAFDTLDDMEGGEQVDARISKEDFAELFVASSSDEKRANEVRTKANELFKLIDIDSDGSIDRIELAGKAVRRDD